VFLHTVVTIWTFLTQVLGPDRCCRAAVAKLLAMLASLDECCSKTDAAVGQTARAGQYDAEDVAPDTGPYCKARERLPVGLLTRLARRAGNDLHKRYPSGRLLGGRRVKIVDGTVVSMPDTPENQARFPQPHTQKPGLGFPIMRVVAVLSAFGAACWTWHRSVQGQRQRRNVAVSAVFSTGSKTATLSWPTAITPRSG